MKITHLLSLVVLTLLFAFNPADSGRSKRKGSFPQYDVKLYKSWAGGSCKCEGIFSSCSQTCTDGDCTCSCGAFSCNCTDCKKPRNEARLNSSQPSDEDNVTAVSMSEAQYKNLQLLSDLLLTQKTQVSQAAQNYLVNMVDLLKVENYRDYHKTTQVLVKTLKRLSETERTEVNQFLQNKGVAELI